MYIKIIIIENPFKKSLKYIFHGRYAIKNAQNLLSQKYKGETKWNLKNLHLNSLTILT